MGYLSEVFDNWRVLPFVENSTLNSVVVEPLRGVFDPTFDSSTSGLATGSLAKAGGKTSVGLGGGDSVLNVPGTSSGGGQDSEIAEALRAIAAGGGGSGGGVSGAGLGALSAMRQRLDAEYGGLRARLDEMYQLSETPQEQAMIEFALVDLEDQYRAADESIGMVFDSADAEIGGYVDDARTHAAGVGDAARATFDAGVQSQLEQEAMARALLGEQFGDAYRAAVAPSQAGAFEAGLTSDAGAREGGYAQGIADLSVEDAEWIQAQQGSLRSANTAEASRLNAALRGEAIRQHQAQVNARINQERIARAQAEQQLVAQQMSALAQLASQEASMRQAAASSGSSGTGHRLQALGMLADLEGNGRTNLSFGDIKLTPDARGRVGPNGTFIGSTLGHALTNLQKNIHAEPSGYNSYALDFLNQNLEGLEGHVRTDAERWLNKQISVYDPSNTASTWDTRARNGGR